MLPVLFLFLHDAVARHMQKGGPIARPHLKRQSQPLAAPPPALATTTQGGQVLTFVTPSPGATPVAITQQSQLVTSFVPQYTLCELPPVAEVFASSFPTLTVSTAPYANASYTVSIPTGTGSCTTLYTPTETMVCATVLDGIATKYTVSECSQDITFSTDYGYILATPTPGSSLNGTNTGLNGTLASVNATTTLPDANSLALITPAPTVQTLTSYYLAPWQDLTTAGPPGEVDMKICTTYENGTEECVVEFYVWHTSLLTLSTTTVTSINITATVTGPSQIIVETFVANVTESVTTFSMSTTMQLEYTTEIETTSTVTRAGSTFTSPTVYETFTVDLASQTP